MAEAVANPAELQLSRELAREKLNTRRSRSEVDYFGAGGRKNARAVGADMVNDMTKELAGDQTATTSIPERVEGSSRFDQFRSNVNDRAQRYGMLRAQRAARRGQSNEQEIEVIAQSSASAFAKKAYARVWQLAEEGVQDFALSFMDFMLISGPAALGIFVVRFVGGNLMGGSGTITYREASVPRIPGYSSVFEGAYKFGKVLLIGLISGLIYMSLLFLIVIITNPDIIVTLSLCAIFEPIVKFFGSTSCTAAS